jgi:hypothetical protein
LQPTNNIDQKENLFNAQNLQFLEGNQPRPTLFSSLYFKITGLPVSAKYSHHQAPQKT